MSSEYEEEAEEESIPIPQEEFETDTTDIVAFSVAAWQLCIPLVIALIIVGVLVAAILNLF